MREEEPAGVEVREGGDSGCGLTPVRMSVPALRVVPRDKKEIILGMLKIKSLEWESGRV